MRRALGELTGKFLQIQVVLPFECQFTNVVLFQVMRVAKTNAPPVRRFQSRGPVGSAANMRAFDR